LRKTIISTSRRSCAGSKTDSAGREASARGRIGPQTASRVG
jgi:hypothetical protein